MSEAIRPILMPKWGLAMTEGTLVSWHVPEGGWVVAGADLCDIETTKITNVFEAPDSGIVARRIVEPGSIVPVGALIGVLTTRPVGPDEIDDFVAGFQSSAAMDAEADDKDAGFQTLHLADGTEVAYRVDGEGDDTLLLVHGFAGASGNWTYQQQMLSTKRRVAAIDLPGHGRSIKALGSNPIATLASAVADVSRKLGARRLHLVGHSLGGAIAIMAAPEVPGLASLTLIASCGLGPEINAGFIEGLVKAERRKDLEPVVAELFADPKVVSRQMINDLLKYKRGDGVHDALVSLAAAAFPKGRQAAGLRPALARIAVPVQVVWGLKDRIIPIDHSEGLPQNLQVHRLPDAGHMPHVERPREVAELIDGVAG